MYVMDSALPFDDTIEKICWAAQCDAAFKISLLGCPAGSIDLGCEEFESCLMNFDSCPLFSNGAQFLMWLLKNDYINLEETFRRKITKEEKRILGKIFFYYYKCFIGGPGEIPPLRLQMGRFGTGVHANRNLKKGEMFLMGYLNRFYVKEEKLLYLESKGALTTCQLEGDSHSREICGPIRYVNHSCMPNCHTSDFEELQVQKNIEEGQELYLYYFDNSEAEEMASFACRCTVCMSSINDEED